MKLTAVFEPAKEGGYTCFVEEIPAAISQGETLEEAKANLRDALQTCTGMPAGTRGEESFARRRS
ncbi:MAG TPA: type II toxin-antitoxin system HicB family antitoxin [Candidatus Binatia bacterium]|nr:type II toxin-antitoxin system HicB family antitoxin [Candidatus Binatia bacterium]